VLCLQDYEGEDEIVAKWVDVALGQSIPTASIYPKKGRCEAAEPKRYISTKWQGGGPFECRLKRYLSLFQ
jgi:hypothetical protein